MTNEDFACLLYTGGTTGFPKGTVWDHETRLKGLDMQVCNGVAGLIDNLARVPNEAYVKTINIMLSQELSELLVPLFQLQISQEDFLEIIKSYFCPPGYESAAAGFTQFLFRSLRSTPKSAREKFIQFLMTPSEKRGDTQEIFRDPTIRSFLKDLMRLIVGTPLGCLFGERVRVLYGAPLFHGAGLEVNAFITAVGSTSIYLASHRFDPKEMLETIERRKPTFVLMIGDAFAIPILEELEKREREYDLSSVMVILTSGVTFSPKNKEKFLAYMPRAMIMDELGTSESSEAHLSLSSAADEEIPALRVKISSDGPYPCRIINPKTGKDVKLGERGELVWGGYVALGYWKNPEKTARDFRVIDGRRWFFVGDDGTVDEEGYFHFIGRGPTVINTGGEKVYPEEVEESIKNHPKVRDVVVVGVPDERWVEAVTAIVELKTGERATSDEIIDYCKERMAGYKKPKHVIFTKELRRGAAGKIEKIPSKEFAKKMLGL